MMVFAAIRLGRQGASYQPVEPALRRHLGGLRPAWTDEQIALYFRRHPEDAP
jgi:hypothetical protein